MIRLLLLILFSFTAIAHGTVAFSDSMTDLLCGWHCDENTGNTSADVKGVNGLDVSNGIAWVSGKYGASGLGGSSGAYALMADPTKMPQGNHAWSIGFWYYVTSINSFGCVVSWGEGLYNPSTNPHEVIIVQTSGGWYIQWWDAKTIGTNVTSTWTQEIITYDGAGTFQAYKNGATDGASASSTYALNVSGTYAKSVCGRFQVPAGHAFVGTVDDIAVVNYCVTSTQAADWYNNGLPPPAPPASTVFMKRGFYGFIE